MSGHPAQRTLRFEDFSIDLGRCLLLRGDKPLVLRPQSFDVLRHLAEHPGRVVTKDELLAAAWAARPASDDSLVQCIKNIRQALGDQARRIVKTVPRRGYLLDADVVASEGSPRYAARAEPSAARLGQAPPGSGPASAPRAVAAAFGRGAANLRPRAVLFVAGVLVAVIGVLLFAYGTRTPAPDVSAAHYVKLGEAALRAEHSAKANRGAIVLFDRALALDPDHVPALIASASARTTGVVEGWVPRDEAPVRLDAAARAIERALKLEPGNAAAHRVKGALLRARHDPEGAVAAFRHALALNPLSAWANAMLGRARIDLGEAEEALADIERAIALDPSEPSLFIWNYWGGLAALYAGKDAGALQWLLTAREPDGTYYRFAVPHLAAAYAMEQRKLSKNKMAELMATSRAQLDRLLDPELRLRLSSGPRAASEAWGDRVPRALVFCASACDIRLTSETKASGAVRSGGAWFFFERPQS